MAIRSGTTRAMARSGLAALNAAARRNQRNSGDSRDGATAVIDAANAAKLELIKDGGNTRLYRTARGVLVVAWLEGAMSQAVMDGGAGFDDNIELFDE